MIKRLLWAGTYSLLAINLGLMVWLWLSPPVVSPAKVVRTAKFADATTESISRKNAEVLPMTATDPLAILAKNARDALRAKASARDLAIMRNNLYNRFAPLFRLLELNEAGLAQLERLLLDRHQLEETARDAILATGTIPTPRELQAAMLYATELVDAQIAATLGPAKTAVFSGFVTRSADYRAVDSLSAKLSYTDHPLTPATQHALHEAIIASTDQAGFLERAGEILEPAQLNELRKTYEAREAWDVRFQLQRQATAVVAP